MYVEVLFQIWLFPVTRNNKARIYLPLKKKPQPAQASMSYFPLVGIEILVNHLWEIILQGFIICCRGDAVDFFKCFLMKLDTFLCTNDCYLWIWFKSRMFHFKCIPSYSVRMQVLEYSIGKGTGWGFKVCSVHLILCSLQCILLEVRQYCALVTAQMMKGYFRKVRQSRIWPNILYLTRWNRHNCQNKHMGRI